MKHIPGSWIAVYNEKTSRTIVRQEADEKQICTITDHSKANPEWSKANADLIAAAPDLLECLELAYNLLEEHQSEAKWYLSGHYNKIKVALKKAKGEYIPLSNW